MKPVKRKPEDTWDNDNFNFEDFLLSGTNGVKAKLSQNKSQRFAVLSLNKAVNTESKLKESSDCTNERLLNNKKQDSSEKKYISGQHSLEDTLFDNINLTQILMNAVESQTKPSNTRSKSENSILVESKKLQKSKTEPTLTSQLSQLYESTQVVKQIDSLSSEENIKSNEEQTDLGDLLNVTNRDKVDSFFHQIKHSVYTLGTQVENRNEMINKILEILSQQPVEVDKTIDEKNASVSAIDASFATALKQVLKSNLTKDVELNKTLEANVVKDDRGKYTEIGPFYGLPLRVQELIKLYKGIDELYDWQDECLRLNAIKNHKNLIYALPTSGGKTLVAEILMLREIMCYKRNAIFILPYVAIVQEKVWALSPFAVALDFLVEEYAASKGVYPPRKRRNKRSIYVATIEKASGLLNSLIETERINEIGLIVVDELHLIGEAGRGSILEALLAKIMFIKADTQIVGMSATIGNMKELCTFLNAEIYTRNFRPVELIEYVKCGPEIAKINYNKKEEDLLTVVRTVNCPYPDNLTKLDPDKLGVLVMEVIPKDSCLIFCPSKKNCENVAYLLCKVVNRELREYRKEEKKEVKNALKDEAGSLCKIFNVSIQFGIAYHHSGLTNEERRIIEDAFKAGILSVICCTSTLAAGVNLPAKRVILRQPYVARDFINLSKYKQMVGRAGRAGLGEIGDSILICTNVDLPKVKKLLASPMDEALSSMHEANGKGLRHLLLSCISLGIAVTRAQLQEVSRKTMLYIQSDRLDVDVKILTDRAISDLFKMGALEEPDAKGSQNNFKCDITVRMETSIADSSFNDQVSSKKKRIVLKNDTKLAISKLGRASIKANFELSRAHQLYDDLYEAQRSLVLLDSLHLLYLVTPYQIAEQIKPNKNNYYNIYCTLNPNELQTARVLGLNESVALKLLSNQQIKNVSERVLNRFYLALTLYDLWNEKTVGEVSEKFQIDRGIVQNLMTSASSFASNVVHFCEELEEFWTFAHLLKGMSQRLGHCCIRELLHLMELPAVKQSRARQLYNAGFKTIHSIAATSAENLIENIEYMPRRVAKQLIAAAKMLLLQKVENLREDAENMLRGVEDPQT